MTYKPLVAIGLCSIVATAHTAEPAISLSSPLPDAELVSYQITFTNQTIGQPMTPPVVAIHDPNVNLFEVGEVASDEIQAIAEVGNNEPLVEFFGSFNVPGIYSDTGVAGEATFGPGESVTINLSTLVASHVFSAVNMIVCTNDGITGVDSVALPTDNDPVVFMAQPYDAGTRVNQDNSYSFLPSFCRTSSDGQIIRLFEAPLNEPRGVIAAHEGQSGIANTQPGNNWDFATTDEVLMVEIVRTSGPDEITPEPPIVEPPPVVEPPPPVVGPPVVPTTAPEVSFNTPDRATSPFGDEILVDVSALDSNGTIESVDLFVDGTFLRTERVSPYLWGQPSGTARAEADQAFFTSLEPGDYEITAVATDNDGETSSVTADLFILTPPPPPGTPPIALP